MCKLIVELWTNGIPIEEIAKWSGLSKLWIACIIDAHIEGWKEAPTWE
jgi:hypothetical protein